MQCSLVDKGSKGRVSSSHNYFNDSHHLGWYEEQAPLGEVVKQEEGVGQVNRQVLGQEEETKPIGIWRLAAG